MFKNYFRIAWRNLLKDRQFTLLNLAGLSTGLACTLFIFLWVSNERQMDHFDAATNGQLYQVLSNHPENGQTVTMPQTPAPLAATLAAGIPEVLHTTATYPTTGQGKMNFSYQDKSIAADGIYASPDFFSVFPLVLQGRKDLALADKRSVVLSRALATRLFTNPNDAPGKIITLQHDVQYTVSGLFDLPANLSAPFAFILPMQVLMDFNPQLNDWHNSDPSTYLLLRPGAQPAAVAQKINALVQTHGWERPDLFVRPFADSYLYNKYVDGVQHGGRIGYVQMFSLIALFILLIACINFMNLSTARASRRMKEVGVRKVVGAGRGALVLQHLCESMLMSGLAMVLAVLLVKLLLPTFSDLTGQALALHFTVLQVLGLLGITLLTGALAGSYPAFYLSGFAPVLVLKGRLLSKGGEVWVRKGLVVFQFALSAVFIMGVLVVYRQIAFMQQENLGYNRDNIVTVDIPLTTIPEVIQHTRLYLDAVKQLPGVISASSMDHSSMVADYGETGDVHWPGQDPKAAVGFGNIGVNYGLMETMGMQMAAGRFFSSTQSADSAEIIFNETAIARMGLKDPVGKTVKMWGVDRRIVGVVKDFHVESLHERIRPFVLRLEPTATAVVVVRLKAGSETAVMARMEQLYKEMHPGFAFIYRFMDQDYQAQYVAEHRVALLSRCFAGLAIMISCLGLFGMAAFTAQRRRKEIGIRKVAGASEGQVVMLLSKDFLQLVALALLIAFPLAGWLTRQWLDGFAYSVHLGPDLFVLTGVAVLLISILTVSFQSVRAAMENPVRSLRAE